MVDGMSDAQGRRARAPGVNTDLVEYLIVVVPDLGSLATVARALAELVATAMIRVLDLVVLVRDTDGALAVLELEAVESMAALAKVEGEVGGLLSDHDIELASFALRPGTAGVVLVSEDRWAEPLSVAARGAGGQIIAGERIPSSRIEAALAHGPADDREGV
jgi:uncharacterized protein DUF6325